MITESRLKELLSYDPHTGLWRWIATRMVAGYVDYKGKGYRKIHIDGHNYQSSRLAYLYMKGHWPSLEMDHIDRNRSNDKWENLREVDSCLNNRNRNLQSNNKSGHKGVAYIEEKDLWRAYINIDGRRKYLGYFKRKEDAVEARRIADAAI